MEENKKNKLLDLGIAFFLGVIVGIIIEFIIK